MTPERQEPYDGRPSRTVLWEPGNHGSRATRLRAGIPVAAKNVFIYLREEGSYPVYLMCRWARVSRSGYHKVAESGFIRDAETPGRTHYFDYAFLPRV